MSVCGKLLGIDPGTQRIGFAVSDAMGWAAEPLEVYRRRAINEDIAYIAAIVAKHEIEEIIFGVPYSLEGKVTPSTERALGFLAALRAGGLAIPITERDEALTSWAAEEAMQARGLSKRERKDMVDAYAAAVILQEVLDERAQAKRREAEPE